MDTNIYELIDLVHVPGVNRELAAKLAAWENQTIAAREEEYDTPRKSFFNTLFVVPRREKVPGYSRVYWFELLQYDNWQWRMVNMVPWTLPNDYQYKVLPTDIIDKMSEFPVEPDKVVAMEGAHSTLLHKTVDVQFVRYSSTHIFGTVKERIPDQVNWAGDMETAFQVFYMSRERYPEMVGNFVKGFMAQLLTVPAEAFREKKDDGEGPEPGKLQIESPGEEPQLIDPGRPVEAGEEQDANLYRLIRLIQVPEFNKLLLLKLHELKDGSLKREIEAYKAKQAYYYKKLFWDQRRKRKKRIKNNSRPPLYWFVLTKFAPADWGMTVIDPWPPAYEPFKEILPGMVFSLFTLTPVHPGKVLEASVRLPAPQWKKLDIQWVRYSSTCVMGTVCENMADLQNLPAKEKEWLTGNDGMETGTLYRLLFHHIRSRPQVAESFIKAFMADMLPRLQSH